MAKDKQRRDQGLSSNRWLEERPWERGCQTSCQPSEHEFAGILSLSIHLLIQQSHHMIIQPSIHRPISESKNK